MGLKGFERRLERMVEGVFARAFRSELRPVELGRRLVREMDENRSVDVKGRTIVPNAFTIGLSQADHEHFAEIEELLTRELCEAARAYARDEGYSFLGPVEVSLVVDPKLRAGAFDVGSRLKEGEGGAGAGSMVMPTGERVRLGDQVCTIGRLPESTVVLTDPGVSRRHAEIRPAGDGYVVVDLGSTNGTRVNGVIVAEHRLGDGDEVTVGTTRMRFEAS
ncbi:MAG: FHA domain-containing protein [Acidimicrobiales bacterium]|nr:FHA domain-containing protein [Acidimicrobiales bacterium]